LTTAWEMGPTQVKERYGTAGADQARWQVWMRQGEGEWSAALDGTWKRLEASAMAIDHSQFVGSGPDVRTIELDVTIAASRDAVYRAWTDSDGFKAAYGPDNEALHADIALEIGGRYEWLFDGKIGSNGCQVLSYLPGRMLSFTWNAPPNQAANREKRTWVVVEFADGEDGHTAVTLTHLGFGEGEEWDTTRDYFQQAWRYVLDTMKKNLE
ncbi:MAG: SRPBCC domain-containing protein, partial [Acidobacteriota bacterium]